MKNLESEEIEKKGEELEKPNEIKANTSFNVSNISNLSEEHSEEEKNISLQNIDDISKNSLFIFFIILFCRRNSCSHQGFE
jgi:hypothetical protein